MADFNHALQQARRLRDEQEELIKTHVLEPIRLLPFPKNISTQSTVPRRQFYPPRIKFAPPSAFLPGDDE